MRERWFQASTQGERLLPPVCPGCLGEGVRAFEVPSIGPAEAVPTAYYCERCAEVLDRRATRVAARLSTAALLGIGMATSIGLAFGGARIGLQLALTLLAPLLPLALTALPNRGHTGPALHHADGPHGTRIWLAARQDFAALLQPTPTRAAPPRARPGPAWELAPVLVAVAWLAGLHWFGRAELRVIQSSDAQAVVLVDQRRRSTIPPTRAEHPYAARAISTLAGRRRLGIISERGEPLVDLLATLWPGRDYVLGNLPAHECLFLERQEYGKRGVARELVLVPGTGPLWELPAEVDLWFSPLSEPASLPTSGGVRTAVRLLPCPLARRGER